MGYLVFGHAVWRAGSYFPHQRLNLCPLHQEHRVLATGPPGKSQRIHFVMSLFPNSHKLPVSQALGF